MIHDTTKNSTTIGILYPGEMGASLGKLLAEDAYRVVTTVEGRSSRTSRLCFEAGLEHLGSLHEVVQTADIVISVVPPAAALQVAEHYASLAHLCSRAPLYIDANSISPGTTRRIEALLSEVHIDFVDAAIHGLASRLGTQGTLYLSGSAASDIASMFEGSLRTKVLGDTVGRASAFKMLLSGVSKGLVALFLEMSLVAQEARLLDHFLHECEGLYPGIMVAIDRMLPTYPQHASRRADELKELEHTIRSLGLEPGIVHAAQQLISVVGQLGLAERHGSNDHHDWTVRAVIEDIASHNPLGVRPALSR